MLRIQWSHTWQQIHFFKVSESERFLIRRHLTLITVIASKPQSWHREVTSLEAKGVVLVKLRRISHSEKDSAWIIHRKMLVIGMTALNSHSRIWRPLMWLPHRQSVNHQHQNKKLNWTWSMAVQSRHLNLSQHPLVWQKGEVNKAYSKLRCLEQLSVWRIDHQHLLAQSRQFTHNHLHH